LVQISSDITQVTSLNNNNSLKSQPMCIKFWYYFSGSLGVDNYLQIATQRLNTNNPILIWNRNSLLLSQAASLQQWIYGRVTFYAALNDKVIIRAKTTNQISVIAIDDVLIQSQACEPPGWCDFESGKY